MGTRKRQTIGVLAGWQLYGTLSTHNYLDSIFRGIRAAAQDRHCNLLLACGMGPMAPSAEAHPAWPVAAADAAADADFVPVGPWNTDGLIVVNPLLVAARIQYVQQLKAQGHPLIFVGTAVGGPAVAVDNESGIRQAMHHLIQHGHQHIAFIAGSEEDWQGDSGDRLRAYQAVARDHMLVPAAQLVVYGRHTFQGGQQAAQQLLASGVHFTAVLASNDESAIGVMAVLKQAGRRIPEDVAVIGFDDRPMTAVQIPPLTTVHSPTFERGYRALTRLADHLEGRVPLDDHIVSTPAHLVIRQSCGCRPYETDLLPQSPATPAAEQLVQTMAQAVMAEARRLSAGQVLTVCQRLYDAFRYSRSQQDPTPFRLALTQILQMVEEVGEDAHVWHTAVLSLEKHASQLWPEQAAASPFTQTLVRQAQTAISESVRRQYRAYMVDQSITASHVGVLNAHLLTAVQAAQIFETLARHLPDTGIHHAGIAFFAAESDAEQHWCRFHPILNPTGEPIHMACRDFPPPAIYPDDVPFILALFPLSVEEKQIGFVVFDAGNLTVCDTIIRQLAAAFRSAQLYREATEGRRLAEEANRMKSRFLSTVSHELRTPLSLIVGLSDMLLQDVQQGRMMLSPAQNKQLKQVYISAQHLDGLIQDVLDLAQSEVNQLQLIRKPLPLAEVLEPIAAIGQQLVEQKGLAWQSHVPDALPTIYGDHTRLRQVLLNLISNAVKFTSQGSVTLSVEVRADIVYIAVQDTGLGIPAEDQVVIFDDFRQSDRTTTRGYGGLGLGLAICKRLVTLHEGQMGVSSSGEEAAGSTFYLKLPILQAIGADVVKQAAVITTARVLLLSERPSGQSEPLRLHLAQKGFAVDVVPVSKQTGWLSAVIHSPPDAIVLDVEMASEQGWEILKLLKSDVVTQDIPLVFYNLEQAQDSGSMLVLDYLAKPIGTAELAQALQRYKQAATGTAPVSKSILIVDDEPGILEMHAQMVSAHAEDVRVYTARNGREALEMMRQTTPDLVLLDLMMPEIDGFGVLEAMQRDDRLRFIPVIVLTAQLLTEQAMARLNQGVVMVLKKGVLSVAETLTHVQTTLERSQKFSSETRRLVRKAMAFIHEHYAESISREDMARHIGVSQGYLSRCFRQEMSISPITYLNRYRVSQAKALLAADEASVTGIAQQVGFADSSYFSRIFRREVGCSPTVYQQRFTG